MELPEKRADRMVLVMAALKVVELERHSADLMVQWRAHMTAAS